MPRFCYDMRMREYAYTMRVKCADGQVRDLEQTGFFTSIDLLNHYMLGWTGAKGPNGGEYRYFTTPEQDMRNLATEPIAKNPKFKVCRWGKQQHEYSFETESVAC